MVVDDCNHGLPSSWSNCPVRRVEIYCCGRLSKPVSLSARQVSKREERRQIVQSLASQQDSSLVQQAQLEAHRGVTRVANLSGY